MVLKLAILLIFSFSLFPSCFAKVTGKQYALMPDLFHIDNFDKCMLLEDEALYCSFTYELEPLDTTNVSQIWNIIKEVSSSDYNYRHDQLRHSICVPVTCPSARESKNDDSMRREITRCYNQKYKNMGLKGKVTTLYCQTTEDPYPVDWLDKTVAIFFACYVAFVIFASIHDARLSCKSQVDDKEIRNTPKRSILAAFSLQRNWKKFSTINSSPDVESLRALQGMRFYNFLLVVWCHTSSLMAQTKIVNTKDFENEEPRLSGILLASGALTMSINFFLSSFLLIKDIFFRYKPKEVMSVRFMLTLIVNRYLRLTPTLAAVLLFYVTWLRFLETGSEWHVTIGNEFLKCRNNGWLNLFYLNNLLFLKDMCMGVTWYLAVEVQFLVLLLPLVCCMRRYPSLTWPILGCLLIINIVGTFLRHYGSNLAPFYVFTPESVYHYRIIFENPQLDYQTYSLIANLSGTIFGFACGYLYHKHRNSKLFLSKGISYQILYVVMSLTLSVGIIVVPGTYFLVYHAPQDTILASVYVALSRPIFILGIGSLIFAATQGLGGLATSFLVWRPTYMLGRLVYSAYLVHMILVTKNSSMIRAPVYYTNFTVLHSVAADATLTFIVALFVKLLIEMPSAELRNFLFTKEVSKVEKKKE